MTGSGNKNDPYILSTYEDLNTELRNTGNQGTSADNLVYIKLAADIEMPSDSMENFQAFSGVWYIDFNGNGKKIKNIKNLNVTTDFGIFVNVQGGKIYDLSIENLYLVSQTTANVAALAYTLNNTEVVNVQTSGRLEATIYGASGMVFYSNGSSFNKCFSNCRLIGNQCQGFQFRGNAAYRNCKSACEITAKAYAFGFGEDLSNKVFNCEVACTFKLIGNDCRVTMFASGNGVFSSCYSHSKIISDEFNPYSLYIFSGGTVFGCYYDIDLLNGRSISNGERGVGAETSDLQNPEWLKEHWFAM